MQIKNSVLSVALTILFVASCAANNGTPESDELSSAEDVFSAVQAEGLTCRNKAAIGVLPKDEGKKLASLFKTGMSEQEFSNLLEGRESDCLNVPQEATTAEKKSSVKQAMAGYNDPWDFESIEDDSIGGSSAQTTWYQLDLVGICGDDYDDGLWEMNYLAYANQFRSYLRFTGNDSFGNCVESFASAMDSRVYRDDSLRMCVRSSYFAVCSAWYQPHTYSFIIGFQ